MTHQVSEAGTFLPDWFGTELAEDSLTNQGTQPGRLHEVKFGSQPVSVEPSPSELGGEVPGQLQLDTVPLDPLPILVSQELRHKRVFLVSQEERHKKRVSCDK